MGSLTSSSNDMTLKINDYVVYPLHGIGNLIKIDGEKEKIYKIKLIDSNMLISIPEKSLGIMGIRKIINKKDLKRIINNLAEKPPKSSTNWRVRFRDNIEKLKSGDILSTVLLIKELFIRNEKKSLSMIERRQFENAFNLLVKEISIATKFSEEEVNSLISTKLDKLISK